MWAAILLHLASVAGPLRVPLVVAILVLMGVGFVTEISKERAKESGACARISAHTRVHTYMRIHTRPRVYRHTRASAGTPFYSVSATADTPGDDLDDLCRDILESARSRCALLFFGIQESLSSLQIGPDGSCFCFSSVHTP